MSIDDMITALQAQKDTYHGALKVAVTDHLGRILPVTSVHVEVETFASSPDELTWLVIEH